MEILITKLIKLIKTCKQQKIYKKTVIFRAIRKNEKWTFINVQILKIDSQTKTRKIKKIWKIVFFRFVIIMLSFLFLGKTVVMITIFVFLCVF